MVEADLLPNFIKGNKVSELRGGLALDIGNGRSLWGFVVVFCFVFLPGAFNFKVQETGKVCPGTKYKLDSYASFRMRLQFCIA